ncbi:MAG: amino acid adenylation domain-containing protein [Kiloniellales bacterium]
MTMPPRGLHQLLAASAARRADKVAVVEAASRHQITYQRLDALSDRLRDRLLAAGVRPGDRVGICLRKSIDSVAAIFGILKAGAAYVPTDPGAPTARSAYVLGNCSVSAAVVEARYAEGLRAALPEGPAPTFLVLEEPVGGLPLETCLDRLDREQGAAVPTANALAAPDQLAYILYTSGSTGKPKGVMLSHENAVSFVDWCSEVFRPDEDDRFSSHAPFHFDLSILDIFLPLKHGATVVLIGEDLGKNPAGMVATIVEQELTIWYSTPSVLRLLVEFGDLGGRDDYRLRTVLFAGEVFPVKHLRRLKEILPRPRYFNLYGPTETNVCTYYEIPKVVPAERMQPYPIGKVCSHFKARVVDEQGCDVPYGEEGELVISGAGTMQGYWQLPERSAAAYLEDGSGRWYRTGDIVVERDGGVYSYVGRRDRMVKRRGFRVELGEIEAALYRHPQVSEAAAIALANEEGVQIMAFYVTSDGERLSLIELKQFCAANLPGYMVPDGFSHRPSLPKTSTDKIDYERLKEFA